MGAIHRNHPSTDDSTPVNSDGEAGATFSRPSLAAGNVPGSAEASGGLQKTHHCEKRLPDERNRGPAEFRSRISFKKNLYILKS